MTTPNTQPTTDEVANLLNKIEALLEEVAEGCDVPHAANRLLTELRTARQNVSTQACPVASKVAERINERAKVGFAKYGTNLTRTDLTDLQWLQHLQDELMDAAVYVERLKLEDTHTAKLREENERLVQSVKDLRDEASDLQYSGKSLDERHEALRTQNELFQSQLSGCVDVLAVELDEAIVQQDETTCVCKYCHVELVENAKHEPKCIAGTIGLLLSTLPTTPNLCERVRELEKQIVELTGFGKDPQQTIKVEKLLTTEEVVEQIQKQQAEGIYPV